MKTIIFFALLLAASLVGAQSVPLAMKFDSIPVVKLHWEKPGNTAKAGTLSIQIRDYDVFSTSSGQLYIEYQDARLVYRRKYLGYAFSTHQYEGNTVFYNADTTKAWIWMPDRYGTPTMKMDLPDMFAQWARKKKD